MSGLAAIPASPTRELVVREFEGADGEWDAWIAQAEGGTFCHLAAWREVIGQTLGHRAIYLVAEDENGAWRGALPLILVRTRVLGSYLLSMPFLNYGGPLGDDGARAALASHAVELARGQRIGLLELRSRTRVPGGLAHSERKVTVLLTLPTTIEELWSGTFKAKLRSQIRRPIKEGMVTSFGADLVEPFYEVFTRNMRDLGTPVLPLSFFSRLAERLPDHCEFGVVWSDGRPVAAGCGFTWSDEFEMTWASSLREFNRSAPNMLLYSAFMERMVSRGVGTFNFGRCTPGGGTHRFKLQWGGRDEPLLWAQWSASGASATPSPDRPLFRVATAAWQRLPLSIANRVGPILARGLP